MNAPSSRACTCYRGALPHIAIHTLTLIATVVCALLLAVNEMFQYEMNSMGTIAGPNDSFLSQLHDMSSFGSDSAGFGAAQMPPNTSGAANSGSGGSSATSSSSADASDLTSKNRNRGNYRCSKVRSYTSSSVTLCRTTDSQLCACCACSAESRRKGTCVRSCRRTSNARAVGSQRRRALASVRLLSIDYRAL